MKPRATLAAVAGLTLAGLVLRLILARQSLAADETFLYAIVHDHGLGRALELVEDTESTPPLHFILAWLGDRSGIEHTGIRIPSVVLGTATIPLVYLLGARTVGQAAGLFAAAVYALAPYSLFYGSEGRAYATLGFLSVASTLALLEAARTGRTRWWLAFIVASAAMLYTHYTAVFVVAAQIAWSLAALPEMRRKALVSAAAVVLLFAPWIPAFLVQRQDNAEQRIEEFGASIMGSLGRTFPGEPFVSVASLPGRVWALLVAVALVACAAALVARIRRSPRRTWTRPSAALTLIAAVALAAPVGAWLYTLGPTSIFIPRNLMSSFPAFCVLLGALVASSRPPLSYAAAGAVLLVLAIGAVDLTRTRFERPPARETAEYLNSTLRPGQPVVSDLSEMSMKTIDIYLDDDHEQLRRNVDDAAVWARAAHGHPAYLLRGEVGLSFGLPRLAGPESRIALRRKRRFDGSVSFLVGRYEGEVQGELRKRGGTESISWTAGPDLEVRPGAARGAIDETRPSEVICWAIDPETGRRADFVLGFDRARLVSIAEGNQLRPDLAKAFGTEAIVAGFRLRSTVARRLRVFAVVGRRATELRPAS